MPYKQFALDDRTPVTIYKRKASRSLRLTVDAKGKVKVSIPPWVPYATGLQFARSRVNWIHDNARPQIKLKDGQSIGKAHRLNFMTDAGLQKPATRLLPGLVKVSHPPLLAASSPSVQRAAEAACIRALRLQAEKLLPQRLAELADKHGFDYRSVRIKQMSSRWGSCDHQSNIVLNLFLIQLPWENIDYVILHELAHTKVLRHGPPFWHALEEVLPQAQSLRQSMRRYQPVLL